MKRILTEIDTKNNGIYCREYSEIERENDLTHLTLTNLVKKEIMKS